MDLPSFFRNIFGIPNPGAYGSARPHDPSPQGDEFRKPIWNLDDEDDDDEDFRMPGKPFSFQVFTNPLEMHRFFEHTMGEILRGVEKHITDLEEQMSDTDLGVPRKFGFGLPALEAPEVPSGKENLRDQYLKPEYRSGARPPLDEDLDAKIKAGGLDSIAKSPQKSSFLERFGEDPFFSRSFSSKQSHSWQSSNGKVESRSTIKDSHGNSVTTVTRKLGDQSYSVTTKIDPNGVEERTENFVNIDGDDLSNFNKRWETRSALPNTDMSKSEERKPGQDWFPWDKLF